MQAGEVTGVCDCNISRNLPSVSSRLKGMILSQKNNKFKRNKYFVRIFQPSLYISLLKNFWSINHLLTRLWLKVKETHSLLDMPCLLFISSTIPIGNSHGYLSLFAIFQTPICLDKLFLEIKLQYKKFCLDLLKDSLC